MHVYNVDEAALFYQLLPERTIVLAGDTCMGGKHNKQWIMVLVGSNTTATDKLKLLVISKGKLLLFQECPDAAFEVRC